MKTQSARIKETSKAPGQMTILAFVFSFIFSPVGLILYFYAKKEGKGPMLTAALVISIIGTIIWGMIIISWIVGAFFFAFLWI